MVVVGGGGEGRIKSDVVNLVVEQSCQQASMCVSWWASLIKGMASLWLKAWRLPSATPRTTASICKMWVRGDFMWYHWRPFSVSNPSDLNEVETAFTEVLFLSQTLMIWLKRNPVYCPPWWVTFCTDVFLSDWLKFISYPVLTLFALTALLTQPAGCKFAKFMTASSFIYPSLCPFDTLVQYISIPLTHVPTAS